MGQSKEIQKWCKIGLPDLCFAMILVCSFAHVFWIFWSNAYTQLGVKHGERKHFTAPRSLAFQKTLVGEAWENSCISQASRQLSHAGGRRLLLLRRIQVMKKTQRT
eukprot:s131_g25.t1